MSENATIQNLEKAGLQKSSITSTCSQGKVYQQLPLTVLPEGNTNSVFLAGETDFCPSYEVSEEVTCLTGSGKYMRLGYSITRSAALTSQGIREFLIHRIQGDLGLSVLGNLGES